MCPKSVAVTLLCTHCFDKNFVSIEMKDPARLILGINCVIGALKRYKHHQERP